MRRLGRLKGGKWEKVMSRIGGERESAKGGGRCGGDIYVSNQVDFKGIHCQSTAGLINSPLAGIIVQAVFEIHQRNGDLL